MNISENIKIKTGNNLLKKCLEKEHSFKTILLLTFFILLPFSNFSIAGDLESLLKCRLIELNQNIILNSSKPLNCAMEGHFFLLDKIILFIATLTVGFKSLLSIEVNSEYRLLIFYEFFVAIFFYLIFIINIILLSKLVNPKLTLLNIFITIVFLSTSYLGNFISFYHQEILIGTLFIIKLLLFDKKNKIKYFFYYNLILDIIITTFKIYYLIPIFFINLYFLDHYRKFVVYNFILYATSVSIFYVNNIDMLLMHLNETYKLDLNFIYYFKELFYIYFSPAIGIVFTAPFFILILFIRKKNYLFKLKLLALIFLTLFLSLFFFWHGSGSSGCRYLYPILILFYKEFYFIFLRLINFRYFKLIVIIAFVSFFQSLNYNSPVLLFGYKDSKFNDDFKILDKERTIGTLQTNERFPKDNYKLSPYYFGWSIELNKIFYKNQMLIETNNGIRPLNTSEILPNTNISRVFYVSENNMHGNYSDKRIQNLNFRNFINLSRNNYSIILLLIFSFYSYLIIKLKRN
jgi:hypothetical protein